MTKKIILTIFVIVALISCSVYATESGLTTSSSASELQNTALVGTEGNNVETPVLNSTSSAEDLQNTTVLSTEENNTSDEGSYISPDMWRGEDGIMPISDDIEVADNGQMLVTGDIFIGEDVVQLSDKECDGNVFITSAKAEISNCTVYGDLFLLGQAMNLQKVNVMGNIYLASQSVTFKSINCTGNMYLAGEAISLSEVVTQDVFVAGSAITVDNGSYIARNLYAGGASVTIGNVEIGRNANISAEDIKVSETATISGDLNKDIVSEEIEQSGFSIQTAIYNVVKTAISALVVCGFIFLFGKGFMEKQKTDKVAGYLFKNLGKGVLFTLLVPVVAILLLCTGLATGLSVLIVFIYIIIFGISTSIVSIAITSNITKNMEYNAWRFYGISILVAIVIAILKQIPIIGVIVAMLVALTGMGVIFSSLKNKKENRDEVVKQAEV